MIRVFELMAHESSASKTSDQMIGLNVFSFFGEENCSSISQKKKNENSFEMVSNPSLAREEELYLMEQRLQKILCSDLQTRKSLKQTWRV